MLKTDNLLLSSADIGHANRARIIRRLYEVGPLSRADLATALRVSRTTIGTVVQPLLDHAVLTEQEPRLAGEAGGKPSRPLWFGNQHTLGAIYLSSEECVVAALSMDGRILSQARRFFTESEAPDAMRMLSSLCDEVFSACSLLGVGVAFAGMVDTTTGDLIANYRRPEVSALPIEPALSRHLGVPIFVDHHPRIQAYGDAWLGLGRGMESFASVVTGEVIGVGIVQGGHVVRGLRGAGGEAGHIVVDMRGERCLCGRRGCWETVATLPWLRDQARAARFSDPQQVDAANLVGGAEAGSEQHRALLHRYADNIALGLANLEQLLGSGMYIVHGDVARGGEVMRALLQSRLIDSSPHRKPEPRVILAPAPDDSTILGATGLVLSNLYRARI